MIQFLLLLFLALPAWGAEYWVDCDAGNDGSDGLSEGAPKLTLASITQADGDVIRIKGGTTCRETLLQTAANLAVSAYGSGRFIIDGEGTRDYGVDTDAKNLTISGFDIRNHVKNNIQFEVNSAGNYSLTASDGISQSTLQLAPATSDVTYGTGFFVTSTGEGGRTGSIGAIITVNIDGVQSNDNGRHGFDFRGNVNGTLRNFKALRNGGNQVFATGVATGVVIGTAWVAAVTGDTTAKVKLHGFAI